MRYITDLDRKILSKYLSSPVNGIFFFLMLLNGYGPSSDLYLSWENRQTDALSRKQPMANEGKCDLDHDAANTITEPKR